MVRVTTVCHGSDSNHIPAAAGPVTRTVTAGVGGGNSEADNSRRS